MKQKPISQTHSHYIQSINGLQIELNILQSEIIKLKEEVTELQKLKILYH